MVDYLLIRPDVDSTRIALYGGSFGGYLAPRAAAFEHRFAACIADAALFDPAALSNKMFPPEIASALAKDDVAILELFFNKLQENSTQRFILGRGGGKHLFNALRCSKEYVLFRATQGAGEHCEAGAREVFFRRYLIGSIPSSPDETYEQVDPLQKTLNVTQPGVAFSAGLGRGFVSCLGCVLLRHVFALTGRAVKRRAFPVVNAGLCVNPHLAVAAAGRLRISHLLIGATR